MLKSASAQGFSTGLKSGAEERCRRAAPVSSSGESRHEARMDQILALVLASVLGLWHWSSWCAAAREAVRLRLLELRVAHLPTSSRKRKGGESARRSNRLRESVRILAES